MAESLTWRLLLYLFWQVEVLSGEFAFARGRVTSVKETTVAVVVKKGQVPHLLNHFSATKSHFSHSITSPCHHEG